MVINGLNIRGGVLVQRGITSGASTVVINKVDMDKTIVLSVSKGSSGYVAARGNVSLTPNPKYYGGIGIRAAYPSGDTDYSNFFTYSGSITGGTTDLTVKEYSARLTSPTTLVCDGPVEWQVIEFK